MEGNPAQTPGSGASQGGTAGGRFRFIISERRTEVVAFLIAFAFGLVLRTIPQLLFPQFPVGFDTIIYMNYGKIHANSPTLLRPFEEILALFYRGGFNMAAVMEVVPSIVYGFLTAGGYVFSRRVLKWGRGLSLAAALNLGLSIAMLRVSWDMHDLIFGLALLLFALSYLEDFRKMRVRGKLGFLILAAVTLVSHQLVTVLFLTTLAVWFFQSSEGRERRVFGAILVAGVLFFVGFWYATNLGKVFGWIPAIFQSVPFSGGLQMSINTISFPFYLYLLIVPVAVVGYLKQRSLAAITAVALLGSLATLLTPTFLLGGVLQWRWVVLLGLPLSFYCTNGLNKLLRGKYLPLLLILVLAINASSYTFMGLTPYPTYYTAQSIMPASMLGVSIATVDIQPTITLLASLPAVQNVTVIVNGNWVGWARLYSDANVVTFSGAYPMYPSLQVALNHQTDRQNLYLLWWNTTAAQPLGFNVVATDGGLNLYEYTGPGAA